MKEQEIISKLNKLKSVAPSESWVLSLRQEVLHKAPFCVEAEHNISVLSMFNVFLRGLNVKKFGYSLATFLFVILASGSAVISMAKSSLPGDALYKVKIANESVVLAVAKEEDRPEIEIEYAGKRLEELAEISKKPSDIEQQSKIEQLVGNYKDRVESVNRYMADMNNTSKKDKLVKIAKVVNVQSEKYTDVLTKVKESMPVTVREKVLVQVDNAINKSETINTSSLMVLVEAKGGLDSDSMSDEEIMSKIQKKIDKIEMTLSKNSNEANSEPSQDNTTKKEVVSNSALNSNKSASTENSRSVQNIANDDKGNVREYSKKELIQMANENIKNNNLLDAIKNVASLQEIGASKDDKNVITNNVEKKDNEVLPVDSGVVDGASDSNKNEIVNSQVQLQKIEPVAVDEVDSESSVDSNEKVETLKP